MELRRIIYGSLLFSGLRDAFYNIMISNRNEVWPKVYAKSILKKFSIFLRVLNVLWLKGNKILEQTILNTHKNGNGAETINQHLSH